MEGNLEFEKKEHIPKISAAELTKKLSEQYEIPKSMETHLMSTTLRLAHLAELCGGSIDDVSVLYGKDILDLGCGSKTSAITESASGAGVYEPWMCRALLLVGARPVGVDVESLDDEPFTHYQRDLTNARALTDLQADSFDVISSFSFISGEHTSPRIVRTMTEQQQGEMEARLRQDAQRLLREGGYYAENLSYFRKTKEGLEPVTLAQIREERKQS